MIEERGAACNDQSTGRMPSMRDLKCLQRAKRVLPFLDTADGKENRIIGREAKASSKLIVGLIDRQRKAPGVDTVANDDRFAVELTFEYVPSTTCPETLPPFPLVAL